MEPQGKTGVGSRVSDPKIRVIRVRVSESEHASITKAADLNSLTVSEAIREAVNEWAGDFSDDRIFVAKPDDTTLEVFPPSQDEPGFLE